MQQSAIAEIRASAGAEPLEGVDLQSIDTPALLRQSELDLAERSRPGTPVYPIAYIIAVFASGYWADHAHISVGVLCVLLAIAGWRNHATRSVFREEGKVRALRWAMIVSAGAFSVITAAAIYSQGLGVGSLLLLLCAGVFTMVGALLTSIERKTAWRFLVGGNVPIMVGLAWDLDTPRAGVLIFVAVLIAITRRLVVSFGHEYWRQLVSTAVVESQKRDLEVARAAAEKASRVRDDLLRNFTHELRTPMNSVLGLLSLAETQSDPEERKQLLRLVSGSAERMLDQVNRVLDVETPHIEQMLRPSSVHPRPFFEAWSGHFAPTARQKGLRLKMRVQDDIPSEILIDLVRLQSILVNLLDNALKFTREGRVDVFVYGVPVDEHVYRLGIAVRDTGPGIPEDSLETIFEPYHQLDPSVTRAQGGLGVGLAIVRMQTQLLGGNVSVTSEEGEGSTFRAEVEARLPRTSELRAPTPQAVPEATPVTSA